MAAGDKSILCWPDYEKMQWQSECLKRQQVKMKNETQKGKELAQEMLQKGDQR